ncbi:MAG TPA: hypothetical protein VLH56_14805, partial [Dissulfurispiraceae bacterium]|nr:hypothetical protein [Dissulfurispiraceae bacterium]
NKKLDEVDRLKRELLNIHGQISSNETETRRLERLTEELRQKWHQVNNRAFEITQGKNCPACGQALPEEHLAAAREKAQAEFNCRKAEELASVSVAGKIAKADIGMYAAANEQLEKQRKAAESGLQAVEAEVRTAMDEIRELRERTIVVNTPDTGRLQADIEALKAGRGDERERLRAELDAVERIKTELQQQLSSIQAYANGQRRIKELEAEQQQLAAEFERLEKELYLCDQFERAKVQMLDNKINGMFEYARFKMFNENINGGIEPCCEVLYDGIPYSTALNSGHRIIVGMDVIRTLARRYEFYPPIFIDNAESVTQLPAMEQQVIKLVKPEIATEEDRQKYSVLNVNIKTKEVA